MNFRVFASGLLLLLVYQLAIAAVAVWFVVHCETGAASRLENGEPVAMAGSDVG